MSKYYAVAKGRKVGIFRSWDECKAQVFKFSKAKFKSFITYHDAKIYLDTQNVIWSIGKKDELSKSIGPNLITNYFHFVNN